MAKKTIIKKYDGKDVVVQSMSLRRTGDGLSQALAIAPLSAHIGDEITLVVRGSVQSLQYRPVHKDTDDLEEVVIVHGSLITVAEDIAVINELLDNQAKENERRAQIERDKKEGVQRIPGTPDAAEVNGDDVAAWEGEPSDHRPAAAEEPEV